jgi:ribosomal-protein-alanine N-acetyltransferase
MTLKTSFHQIPRIRTSRLLLRALHPTDMEALFFLRSDEEVMRYIDRPRAQQLHDIKIFIEQANADIEERTGLTWGICFPDQNTLFGYIGYWRMQPSNYRAEVGYALHPDYQGKGFAREALEAVIDFGFNQMGLHSIEANINPDNDASRQLLLRCGFVKEAYFRQNYLFNGQFLDSEIYSLLSTDVTSKRQP